MVQFASFLRRVLCKTRLIFPLINGPIVHVHAQSNRLKVLSVFPVVRGLLRREVRSVNNLGLGYPQLAAILGGQQYKNCLLQVTAKFKVQKSVKRESK